MPRPNIVKRITKKTTASTATRMTKDTGILDVSPEVGLVATNSVDEPKSAMDCGMLGICTERVLATSSIARMNLLLHGVEDFKIVREDRLRNPAFYTGGHLAQFDCVVANPPFSLKNWGEMGWAADKWGRNSLGGVPPKGYADWAWVQHMLTSARPTTGRVAVVLPQGALFRQGAEARIRSHVLKSDVVDAVIGLS